jgi:hypothetical protein
MRQLSKYLVAMSFAAILLAATQLACGLSTASAAQCSVATAKTLQRQALNVVNAGLRCARVANANRSRRSICLVCIDARNKSRVLTRSTEAFLRQCSSAIPANAEATLRNAASDLQAANTRLSGLLRQGCR